MMRHSLYRIAAGAFLALALLGCEEDIVLVDGSDRAFTLYGVLNPTVDTQFVHVFPVEGKLESSREEALAAHFTSFELETGETLVWSDSLVRDQLGHYGHVFWAPVRVEHEHNYQLEIEAPDGTASRVDVEVPPVVRPLLGTATIENEQVITPVKLEGEAPRLLRVEVTLMGRTILGFTPSNIPEYLVREATLSYHERAEKTADGWSVPVELREGYDALFRALGSELPDPDAILEHGIELLLVTVHVIIANDEWSPPGGLFDPLALAHPDVMTNVENGYGFVGAGYRVHHSWRPPLPFREAAGFVSLL